jgi:phosphoribosylaminoimidazolecarboxamide formyltransferase/IMP cyclohydrolase
MIRRAILSVSNKSGLAELGTFLSSRGIEMLSTGGSARTLQEANLDVTEVADYTKSPEMMDGRVKTLHPKVHGGILALRDVAAHRSAMQTHGIANIDLVVVNLYPFEETVAKGAPFADCIENIDIGGPAMIRSAAKNHAHVAVVVDPNDYQALMEEIEANDGAVSDDLRRHFAAKAYAHTGAYDAAISSWFAHELGTIFPERLVLSGQRQEVLRYGENPHQDAAFYVGGEPRPGIATAQQVQGKALSFNNLNDTDAAYELVAEFDQREHGPAVAIIKHANPCGVALGDSLAEAYRKAFACDPVSAFGGIIALNSPLDGTTAEEISEIFTEVIVAPDADNMAKEVLARKKNLRLLLTGTMPDPSSRGLTVRSLAGGYLLQTRDDQLTDGDLKVVTKRSPSASEMNDLTFAFTVVKHVKSNTIVYAKNGATVGVGAGQMSRVDSARLAVRKAKDVADAAGHKEPATIGSVAASDAFFPFADGLLAAVEAGATAVIQPGGSIRDDEVIAAADEAGISMIFTGMRHFRH